MTQKQRENLSLKGQNGQVIHNNRPEGVRPSNAQALYTVKEEHINTLQHKDGRKFDNLDYCEYMLRAAKCGIDMDKEGLGLAEKAMSFKMTNSREEINKWISESLGFRY